MGRPQAKHVRVDPSNPQAAGQCDLCGRWYQIRTLRRQSEWAGQHIYEFNSLRCQECWDTPAEFLRTVILPPDPPPVQNARVPNFVLEEVVSRILEFNASKDPPWGAGPQTLRCLQNGETVRLLEFSESVEGVLGRITDQAAFSGTLAGAEIMEIVQTTGTPNTPADGRMTSLPAASTANLTFSDVMELISTVGVHVLPLDGRVTSLQQFTGSLTGTEVMELVMPNNASTGQNYQITTALLAAFFSSYPFSNVAKVPEGSSYTIKTTDNRILVVSGSAAPTSITAPLAASMALPYPILVKDWIGDAGNNNIQIAFSGGELCDGLSSVVIGSAYGWVTLNPSPGGGSWFLS